MRVVQCTVPSEDSRRERVLPTCEPGTCSGGKRRFSHPPSPEVSMVILLFTGIFAASLVFLLKDHNRNFRKY